MKDAKSNRAKRTQALAICSCFCLLALGAGVGYRAMQESPLEAAQQETDDREQRVTVIQSPPLDTAILAREQASRDAGEAPEAEAQAAAKPQTQKQPQIQEQKQEPVRQSSAAEPLFAYPLEGEVVLAYSADHAIYDPTLAQYRTNESISLSAAEGTEVKAAADGTVKTISADAQTGNTIVIEHANGWLTTYGQLEQAAAVKEGESVKQGQVIGAVDAPTKYGAALGAHLDFSMEKDGKSVNPQEKLQPAE